MENTNVKKRSSQPKRSYAEIINSTEVLVEAMTANQEMMPEALKGDFSKNLKAIVEEAKSLNVAQEKLKAALKEQTAQLEDKMKAIKKQYADAKKRIKLDVKQELWKEFGFEDKR